MCSAKTQFSLGIHMKEHWALNYYWVHSEDSDQTGRMPRLIWVFAGSFCWFCCVALILYYHDDLKFPDRQVCANSWDPDQTSPFRLHCLPRPVNQNTSHHYGSIENDKHSLTCWKQQQTSTAEVLYFIPWVTSTSLSSSTALCILVKALCFAMYSQFLTTKWNHL